MSSTVSKPLLWFRFRTDGKSWRVYFATHEHLNEFPRTRAEREDADKCSAITFATAREIYIDVSHPEAWQHEACLHELAHACLDGMAADGVTPLRYDREEDAVQSLSIRLWPTLKRFGLKWPRKPRGYSAMRRAATGGR